ncbi:unnamed protein product [Amoebophrya sp. A25]|nr:unnamed protein product [Amoebophrya sp. A25]|eukprot:GSA25T00013072001.1
MMGVDPHRPGPRWDQDGVPGANDTYSYAAGDANSFPSGIGQSWNPNDYPPSGNSVGGVPGGVPPGYYGGAGGPNLPPGAQGAGPNYAAGGPPSSGSYAQTLGLGLNAGVLGGGVAPPTQTSTSAGAGGSSDVPADAFAWLHEKRISLMNFEGIVDGTPKEYVAKTELTQVPAWRDYNATAKSNYQEGGSSGSSSAGAGGAAPGSPFPPDLALNQRVRLFCGDFSSLEVDAISFDFCHHSLTRGSGGRLLSLGGGKLVEEMLNLDRMRSGDAQIMKGNFGNLHCRQLVPFCGPNYKPKYVTAAKNTLSQCLRNCLTLSHDQGHVKTVAFPCHYSVDKAFPLEDCLHVVLRTLRRWLPKVSKVSTVVLYTDNVQEYELCQALLQLYFPRNVDDSLAGMAMVQSKYFPTYNNNIHAGTTTGDDPGGGVPISFFGTDVGEEVQEQARQLKMPALVQQRKDRDDSDSEDALGNSFGNEFVGDWTEKEVSRLDATLWDVESTNDLHHIYLRYIREAASPQYRPTMQELDKYNFLTYAGKDSLSRDILVFAEALIPIARYEQEVLIRYIVSKIEPYSNGSFLIVYAHGGMSSANAILEVWKELIRISQFKYSRWLQNLLVLHPTLSFKAAFALLSYYIPDTIYDNSIYFETIGELTSFLNFPGLELAPIIRSYEQERNASLFGNWW